MNYVIHTFYVKNFELYIKFLFKTVRLFKILKLLLFLTNKMNKCTLIVRN